MIIAGLMSGTSADALDIAVVEFTEDPGASEESPAPAGAPDERTPERDYALAMRLLDFREVPLDASLRAEILELLAGGELPLALVSGVDARMGRFSGDALAAALAERGITCDLVVSHGQTVRHDVERGAVTSTLQLGQPAWIAGSTGAPVLSDIRARDIAAGGQGAPLAGILDELLLSEAQAPTAALNLGGIANITVVAPGERSVAFDTGPANALIDLMARRISQGALGHDHDGAFAATGRTDPALLRDLLAEPYYGLSAPKSTGKELFNERYLRRHLAAHQDLSNHDVIATLTTLTAATVARACRDRGVSTIIASGGGTRNPTLMAALRAELGPGTHVMTTDEAFGLPEGAKEACLMALIGWLTWHGLPSTLPHLTGARSPTVAGGLSPGDSPLQLPLPRRRPPRRLRVSA